MLLRTLSTPLQQLEQLRKRGKLPKPELDEQGAKLLTQVLRNRQNDYPTTLAQDNELIQALNVENSLENGRREMAVRVRAGEKEVLQIFLNGLQAYLDVAADGLPKRALDDASRESKKRKMA